MVIFWNREEREQCNQAEIHKKKQIHGPTSVKSSLSLAEQTNGSSIRFLSRLIDVNQWKSVDTKDWNNQKVMHKMLKEHSFSPSNPWLFWNRTPLQFDGSFFGPQIDALKFDFRRSLSVPHRSPHMSRCISQFTFPMSILIRHVNLSLFEDFCLSVFGRGL
jgi:hypothetical protein